MSKTGFHFGGQSIHNTAGSFFPVGVRKPYKISEKLQMI